jgi:hypothetical protein
MTRMLAKIYSLLTVTMLFLIACKKDNSTAQYGHRLVRTITKGGDSALYSSFFYDAQDRLVQIVDSENTNHSKSFTLLIYDSDGKWVKSMYSNDFSSFVGQDSLWYNNNKIVKKTYSNSMGYSNKSIYVYDNLGRLTNDTTYSYWSNGYSLFQFADYRYNSNDDIVSWQSYELQGGTFQTWGAITASYNNSINPYSDLGMPLYILRMDNTLLSKHQMTQLRWFDGTPQNYIYTYYPNDLVKTIVLNPGGTIEFFYD